MEENRQIPVGITEREYIKKYAGDDFYKKLRRIGILGYVLYVLLFVLSIWLPMTSLERLIFLGLTLATHLGKSKSCACVLLGFGILTTAMLLIVQPYGCLTGITEIVVAIAFLRLFNQAYREYSKIKTQESK